MAKVLLVEDDINLREIYAARLMAENYEVLVASDGEEALSVAVQNKPDVIVLDVMMPKISGFDVLDIMRSTPETKDARVIMLTALSQDTDRDRAKSLGADKYLVKSQITLEDVINAVREVISSTYSPQTMSAPVADPANPIPDTSASVTPPPINIPDLPIKPEPTEPGNTSTSTPS